MKCDIEFSPEVATGCEVTNIQVMTASYVTVTKMTTLPTSSLINLLVESTQILKPGETVSLGFDLCITYSHKGSGTSESCFMSVTIPFTFPTDTQTTE